MNSVLKSNPRFLGHGATAAHQTLDLWILVRVQVPQPDELVLLEDSIFNRNGANEPDAAILAAQGSFMLSGRGVME